MWCVGGSSALLSVAVLHDEFDRDAPASFGSGYGPCVIRRDGVVCHDLVVRIQE